MWTNRNLSRERRGREYKIKKKHTHNNNNKNHQELVQYNHKGAGRHEDMQRSSWDKDAPISGLEPGHFHELAPWEIVNYLSCPMLSDNDGASTKRGLLLEQASLLLNGLTNRIYFWEG